MFDRFTDHARRVIVRARAEARRLEYNQITAEHLLLALTGEREGLAATALVALGVDLDQLHGDVEQATGRGDTAPTGRFPFHPHARSVLELALREALQVGHNYVGTEHLLLSLCRDTSSVPARVLADVGVDYPRARGTIRSLLAARGDTDGSGADRLPPSDEPAHLERIIPLVQVVEIPPQLFTIISLDVWSSFMELRYALSLGPVRTRGPVVLDGWHLRDDTGLVYRSRHMRQEGRMLPVVFTQRFMPRPSPAVTTLTLALYDDTDGGVLHRMDIPLQPRGSLPAPQH